MKSKHDGNPTRFRRNPELTTASSRRRITAAPFNRNYLRGFVNESALRNGLEGLKKSQGPLFTR